MQYEVPQFIDVEDKIFGPLTFKQFVYLAGAAGITVICFTLLNTFFAFLLAAPFVGLGLALAFYKINDKPFIEVMGNAIAYYFGNKLYLWKQREISVTSTTQVSSSSAMPTVPSITASKLKDLAWSLNIKEKIGH